MLYQDVFLEDVYAKLPVRAKKSRLTLYMPSPFEELTQNEGIRHRPTVLILPGGGYRFTADREGEPLALRFVAQGINAAVLYYNCAPDGAQFPDQLLEAAAAMDYLRTHADELGVDKNRVAVMGFSAGGHLAASIGTLWKEPVIRETLGVESGAVRPDGMILCYAVLTNKLFNHRGSFENLLGTNCDDKALQEKVSLEKQVDADTPPAFIWHTFNDEMVPVNNALDFAAALDEKKVPFELHIYPDGAHGLSLCDETTAAKGIEKRLNPYAANWIDHAVAWVKAFVK